MCSLLLSEMSSFGSEEMHKRSTHAQVMRQAISQCRQRAETFKCYSTE